MLHFEAGATFTASCSALISAAALRLTASISAASSSAENTGFFGLTAVVLGVAVFLDVDVKPQSQPPIPPELELFLTTGFASVSFVGTFGQTFGNAFIAFTSNSGNVFPWITPMLLLVQIASFERTLKETRIFDTRKRQARTLYSPGHRSGGVPAGSRSTPKLCIPRGNVCASTPGCVESWNASNPRFTYC